MDAVLKATLFAPGVQQADIDAVALVVQTTQDPAAAVAILGPLERAGFATQASVIRNFSQTIGQNQQSLDAFARTIAPLQSTLAQAGVGGSLDDLRISLDKFFTNSDGSGSVGDPSRSAVLANGLGPQKIQVRLTRPTPHDKPVKTEVPAPSALLPFQTSSIQGAENTALGLRYVEVPPAAAIAATAPKFTVEPNKWNYFFGKVKAAVKEGMNKKEIERQMHNEQRSKQIARVLDANGIKDDAAGRAELMALLDRAMSAPSIRHIETPYGVSVIKPAKVPTATLEFSFFYPKDAQGVVDFAKTPSVTTLIPKEY